MPEHKPGHLSDLHPLCLKRKEKLLHEYLLTTYNVKTLLESIDTLT